MTWYVIFVGDRGAAQSRPAPTREALYALAAEFFAVPLDPERPLWENRFVDGLFDGSVALLTKIHHAVLDGGSGLETFASIFALDDTTIDDSSFRQNESATAACGAIFVSSSASVLRIEQSSFSENEANEAGAVNAALFAVAMLAQDDTALREKLAAYRQRQTEHARGMSKDLI